ncbi:MAG: hypothetical protein D6731_08235 [Planctomycetota bacterium]|nr:MAG: hypothetical protein D6731_08235 [Planctomycetota bacterium]
MTRRRGFTLVELAVYLGLVATALTVFAGVEVTAQRAISLQGALIDVERQANEFLGALRGDVEAARRLDLRAAGSELLVERCDGSTVIYRSGERVVLSPKGSRERDRYPLMRSLRVVRTPAGVRAEALLARGAVRRRFLRGATPRLEVARGR